MPQIDRVNGLIGDLGVKAPCDLATTVNITLSGEQTIDGELTAGSRVLVKNNTDGVANGVYLTSSGAWVREPDFDGLLDVVQGTLINVARGTQAGLWRLDTVAPVIGTSSLSFSIFPGTSAQAVAIIDSAGLFTATTVEAALAEGVTRQATIALLRAVAPISGHYVFREAHTTAGDGGHLMFRGVTGAAPGTYVDNNGTIVIPSGGDGSAAWVAVLEGHVDVRCFGAKGDGVDDTTALNNAAAALPLGGSLYFPKGTYKTTTGVVFGPNIHVFGDGIYTSTISSGSDVVIVKFSGDYFDFSGMSIVGPGNPAYTNSIGLQTETRVESSIKVGAQNFSMRDINVRNSYIGCSFEGTANSLINGLHINGCYDVGLRCWGAQGKWNSINVSACFSHAILLEVHPTPALSMASPFLSNVETFANGGWGIKVKQGMGLQLIDGFLNNDSDGEIFFDTNTLSQLGQLTNVILQFAGDNPFDPRNDPANPFTGDNNAPGIRIAPGGTGSVLLTNISTFNNAGCDIETDGQTIISGSFFSGMGAGIPVRGAFPAIPPSADNVYAFRSTGGANIISGVKFSGAVKIAGNNNVLSGSTFSNNSLTIPTFDVVGASVNNVFSALNIYQNDPAGISIQTSAASSYYSSAVGAPAGTTNKLGTAYTSAL